MELRPYQRAAIDALMRGWDGGDNRQAVVLPTGSGKGHPLDTEVPTPQGLRRWGDLVEGDQVFGSDGRPTEVTGIYDRGVQDIYRVTFSDGSTVETDGDHLWQVRDMKYRRTTRENTIVSTRELLDEPKKLKRGYRFRIPMAEAVSRDDKDLPIEPYTLGAMLANGSMVNGALQLSTPDEEVVARIRKYYTANKINDTTPGVCPRYWLPELRGPIASLGLDVYSRDKFIPRQYLDASASQRLALLQGLMDGDGSTRADSGRRSALYHSTSQRLLDGVRELVTSLGGNASVGWSDRPDGKDCGTVYILLPSGVHPFSTRRKGAEPQGPRKLQPRRSIVSVDLVRRDISRCITVAASDRLYLITRDHIVTHNTVVFSHLIFEMRRYGVRRSLVIAHREELLDQAADKIKKVAPHLKVGVYQGSRKEYENKDVVVASVQTLGYRRPCLNKIVNEDGSIRSRCGECTRCNTLVNAREVGEFDLIIVDECHHAGALSYRRVLRHFGAWEGVPVAGFTATMTRQQGGLDKVWHDVAYRREIAEMIRDGYLVAPKGKQVVVKDMDLSKAKVTAGDFTTKSLSDLMLDSSAMTDIASAYKEHASDRPGIVFCPTVAVAHEMAEAFKAEGITAATVWGAMTNDERRHTLSRFSSGEVQVLVNCMVLTEGFDEPKASCLVVARPTKNHGLYIQMVGRVLRLSPETGKTDALILDVTGATTRHKLVSVSDLTGKKKGVKGTKHGEADDEPDGTQIKPETEAGVQMEKELLAIGGWRDVDLMSASSGARWLRSPKGYRFVLADDRAYFAVPAVVEGMYHLRMVHKGVPVVPPGDPSDTLEKAMAELDRIGLAKASTYDNVSAPWRSRPASEKLRRFAEKMHIDLPENVRAGDVSDAIAVKKNGTQVDRVVEEHERRLKEARGV